jgi:demethylmenaquinone methyltransferase / 2-methoxy-6-polyprenyl-1,4-benzoquinol methylase
MSDGSMSEGEAAARTEREADFGYRRVPVGAKQDLVREVFDRVAGRYDLMNDLMSLGIHRLWKDAMVDWLAPRAGQAILELAGGTGDVAFRIWRRTQGKARIFVCDINEAMIRVGRDRAIDRAILHGIDWLGGNAEALPFADRSVDAYIIAFGLRNVTHIDAALAEARRVLKPGGRFLCLEFSRVALPLLGELYERYSFAVVPRIGGFVTGNVGAYRYLVESIRRFPAQAALAERIARAGLSQIKIRNLSGGIAALHSAWRV